MDDRINECGAGNVDVVFKDVSVTNWEGERDLQIFCAVSVHHRCVVPQRTKAQPLSVASHLGVFPPTLWPEGLEVIAVSKCWTSPHFLPRPSWSVAQSRETLFVFYSIQQWKLLQWQPLRAPLSSVEIACFLIYIHIFKSQGDLERHFKPL